jgi:transcriptional regulator with XRE-family HTH domain
MEHTLFNNHSNQPPLFNPLKKSSLASQAVHSAVTHRKSIPQASKTTWQLMLQEIISTTNDSVSQLAIKLGLSTSTLNKILSGKNKNPHHLTFHKILNFYCTVLYLSKKGDTYVSSNQTYE